MFLEVRGKMEEVRCKMEEVRCMMKHKIMILGALMLMMSVTSCHKESDGMLSYVYNDDMAFAGAKKSYAEEFKVFWNAMNSTYSLWDYEEACGLDWDEHYRVMLPKFEALDTTTSKVSDEQLKKLMDEMVAPLHDGHMKVSFMNHATGNYVKTGPGIIRNEERPDFMLTYFVPDLQSLLRSTGTGGTERGQHRCGRAVQTHHECRRYRTELGTRQTERTD